jgi:hypothetical protein
MVELAAREILCKRKLTVRRISGSDMQTFYGSRIPINILAMEYRSETTRRA